MLIFVLFNFIINIIFLGFIIYFIVKLSTKNCECNSPLKNSEYNKTNNMLSSQINKSKKNKINKKEDNKKEDNKKEDNKKEDNKKEDNKKIKFKYDKKKCFECIRLNQQLGIFSDCPHCGSENYDTGCIPTIVKDGKPNNCIPKDFTPQQAYLACKSASNSIQSCNLIHPKYMLEYQKKECKRDDGDYDYYCAYDESDSCSYNKCRLDDYYSYGPQSICDCQKVSHENLPKGYGRECIKDNNCKEFHPITKSPELLTDPGLKRFYDGYGTWMDVPALNTWYSALIADVQPI